MRATYGLHDVASKEAFAASLIQRAGLAIESQESIFVALYSSMFLKVDMDLSRVEYQARNGQLWSKQDPYRRRPAGDEEAKEGEEPEVPVPTNVELLGTSLLRTSSETLLPFNVTHVNILAIHPRRDMTYIARIELRDQLRSLN